MVTRHKLVERSELPDRLAQVRSQGLRIAFTNGCFDLIHVGHLHTLQTARQQADFLVVGVNSDESVRRLKGARRPLVAARDRAELLAGFACVDLVVVFEEDTPVEILDEVRPDVHIKGGDYKVEDLPEREVVESHGGRILITPLVPGHSTSRLESMLRGLDP
ncbi:MAG: D-glycero-beta-D-manno-heptose 1-phosphate adenylyltransferase [Vulcanimicrobiota bacterium]